MKWCIKPVVLGFLSMAIAISSCDQKLDEATLDLNFTLTYNSTPLVAFEEITYPLGFTAFFTKYSFYLSDITLNSSEGNHVLSNVEFLDLLTGVDDQAKAISGKTLTYLNVPVRSYSSVSFNIGVPAELNATAPAEYAPDSPLSNNGEYWVGWSSYIFHKIEGKMDTDQDGIPEGGIALHLGSDLAFRSVNVNAEITIDKEKETVNINFDLGDILNINGSYFNFLETPQIHHQGVLPKALPILDNTVKNISIREI